MCPAPSEISKVYAARIEDHGGSSVSNINLLALAVAAIGLTSIEAHAEKIDLTGFKLTFDEEFDGRSISQTGATTTWADIRAANRYDANSDIGFGKSSFLDSASGYDPFAVRNGALTITGIPYTVRSGYPGSWQSGLIHSRQSFVQSYGYFEMRAKFNSVPGTWPAFWLLPATTLHPAGRNGSLWQELDVVEQYGAYTQGVYSTIHTTQAAPSGVSWNFFSSHPEISSGFHTYGMDWEPATIKYYVDGVLMGTKPTPDDMAGPMYVIFDLARDTPYAANAAAMTMDVDYVRAFSKDPNAVAVVQAAVSTPGGSDPGLYGATSAKAPPADVLTLSLYEDAYKGDCEFTVSVDGAVIGGVRTTTGTKAQPQSLSLPANLARGAHKVTVNFLNDIYEGQGKDRNLFMAGLKVDGVARYGFGDMGAGGPHTYAIQIP
ncbi:glycosyl hydrolase family protein [Lichenibacterium minor]|uniref:Glycosyl hydrolase family protein n=1 Tax=Lichenibacterium minor TaxID=2316528 RepID=A0A4Q2U3G5_9HYPH|nr:glycosyl hydrolase family protein [Lichenibacterium minor]